MPCAFDREPREWMVESRGIPHLAKNERDVGHRHLWWGQIPKGRRKWCVICVIRVSCLMPCALIVSLGSGLVESRGIPHLAKNERDAPISWTLPWTKTACAPFVKERRMKFAERNNLHRKSGVWGTRLLWWGQIPKGRRKWCVICVVCVVRVSCLMPCALIVSLGSRLVESCGIPHLAKNERDAPISWTLPWTRPRVRLSLKKGA